MHLSFFLFFNSAFEAQYLTLLSSKIIVIVIFHGSLQALS